MFQERRTLIWKYYQSVIMIEYFQDDLASPFSILNILPFIISVFVKMMKKVCKSRISFDDSECAPHMRRKSVKCLAKPVQAEARIKHAKLMKKLINRLRESNEKGKIDTIEEWN